METITTMGLASNALLEQGLDPYKGSVDNLTVWNVADSVGRKTGRTTNHVHYVESGKVGNLH